MTKQVDITDWQTRQLRVAEVARVCGVSVASVWRMTKTGKIPAPRKLSSNTTRWDGAALAAALAREGA